MAAPSQVAMASSLVAQTTAQFIANNAVFTRFSYRGFESNFYQRSYVPGNTLQLPLDYRNTIQRGYTATSEAIVTRFQNLTLQPLYSFSIAVNMVDQYLGYSEDALKALMRDNTARMVSAVEHDICADLQTQSYMYVDNTSGSGLVDTTSKFQLASTRLFEAGVPMDNTWTQILSGADYDALATSSGGLLNQFVPVENEKVRRNNVLRELLDFRTTKSQNIVRHTAGAAAAMAGPIQVATAVTSGNTIQLKGLTSGSGTITNAFVIGDRITLQGIQAINYSNMDDTDFEFTATVIANADSDNSGNCTITITPTINTNLQDANRNLNETIPVNTVVSVLGNHKVQPAYQERGLVFVSAPYAQLEVPGYTVYTDPQSGLTVAAGIQGSLNNAQNFMRVFLLAGWTWLPDLVCVNASALNA